MKQDAKTLEKNLGGKWTWENGEWKCDDGRTIKLRCARWWLYGAGTPEPAEKYFNDPPRK